MTSLNQMWSVITPHDGQVPGVSQQAVGWTSARSPYPSINVAGYRCPCRALCWLLRVSGWRSFGLRVADLFDLFEDEVACLAIWRARPCRWRAWVPVAATMIELRQAAQRRRVVGGCPTGRLATEHPTSGAATERRIIRPAGATNGHPRGTADVTLRSALWCHTPSPR